MSHDFSIADHGQTYPLLQQPSSSTLRPTSHSYHS
jgi:hypothetical protein